MKAYGTAAAVSVALSDAETVGGKSYDALDAVPNLMERYRQAKYVVDHRSRSRPPSTTPTSTPPIPGSSRRRSRRALRRSTASGRRTARSPRRREAFASIRPNNLLESVPRAKEHVETAWAAKPDLESIEHLADQAQKVATFLKQLNLQDTDVPRLYADLRSVMDNFASDEIVATLGVMGAAFALAYTLGMAAGYWGRRGRPGFIAGTLQRWGTRHFSDWYVGIWSTP